MDANDLIAALTGAAQANLPPGAKLATVDPAYSVSTGGTYPTSPALPKVTFDGETTMSTKRYPVTNGYIPRAGDRVLMIPVGRTFVIVGAITNTAALLNRNTAVLSSTGYALGSLFQPPGCKIRISGTYGLVAGAATWLPWASGYTTKDYEVGGTWHVAGGGVPDRVTCPSGMDGFYDVRWAVTWPPGDGTIRIATMNKNAVQIAQAEPQFNVNSIFGTTISGAIPMIQLAAGDYLSISYYHNASGTLNAANAYASTYFSVMFQALV